MMKQLMLLLRVSKPKYNELLYHNHVLYMNPQLSFNNDKNDKLLAGQFDKAEAVLSEEPAPLFYSTDNKKTWQHITKVNTIRKDSNAYIYCMYAVTFSEANYNKDLKKYYYRVPWEYIKGVWQEGYELMVISNTSDFLASFRDATKREKIPGAYGFVQYDLQEQYKKEKYFSSAINDSFSTVFHKKEYPFSIQKEFRFAVIDTNKPDHYELLLRNDCTIRVSLLPLKSGRDILIELSDLEFNADGTPLRFSANLTFYESNQITES